MPGLKQTGCIARDWLTTHLSKSEYSPVACTLYLCKNTTLPVMFYMFVNYFGVKYTGDISVKHSIEALQKMYSISID